MRNWLFDDRETSDSFMHIGWQSQMLGRHSLIRRIEWFSLVRCEALPLVYELNDNVIKQGGHGSWRTDKVCSGSREGTNTISLHKNVV